MGTLAFFPWLRLPLDSKPLQVAGFELSCYVRDEYLSPHAEAVATVLAPYVESGDRSIDEAVLLRVAGRDIVDDMDDDQVEAAFELGEMIALAGLAGRKYFSYHGYSNRDNYRLTVQRFDEPGKGVLQRSPRRDGSRDVYITAGAHRVECPKHVQLERIALDEHLLRALVQCRGTAKASDVIEAMMTFNLANTDNPVVAEHVELVLSSGALEKVLGVRSGNEHEFAAKFSNSFTPRTSVNAKYPTRPLAEDKIRVAAAKGKATTMRELWVRDLFRLRGEFAHGTITARRSPIWSTKEHLLLASYVFPLVLKTQLQKECLYTMTEDDLIALDAFEQLAQTADLSSKDEEDQSIWNRVVEHVRNQHRRKTTLEALAKRFPRSNNDG